MIHDITDIKKAFRKTTYCVSVSKTINILKETEMSKYRV
jgi:hypothetical protein